MEFPRGGNPEPEPEQPEPTREELEEELRGLGRLHDLRKKGLNSKVDSLELYIDDIKKIETRIIEIEKQLGLPPRDLKNFILRWPKSY